MATNKIKDFFNGRFFIIPKYQRGYAWERQHVRDLFDDITESIESNSDHFVGTIVLSKTKEKNTYYIVDGQQRITTITLIISRLIDKMDKENRSFFKRFYIQDTGRNGEFRLRPLSRDSAYFNGVLAGTIGEPENKSQRFMKDVAEEIDLRVDMISDKSKFMEYLENLQIVEFVEDSEGDAIRIFQTVNDRGKLLSNMEKAKSLLIYFSNRYLEKSLDYYINETFSEIFELYDDIKHTGEELGITLISSKEFDEDNLMRYHFVTFSNESYDPTASYVFNFLKVSLSSLRAAMKSNGKDRLDGFINNYVTSLKNFFASCRDVVLRASTNPKYFKLFCVLNLSATLYPLIVKLEQRNILDKTLPNSDRSYFDMVETIDVRVYKTRATDPKADVGNFVCGIDNQSEKAIAEWLDWFNTAWMSEESFNSYLNDEMYQNKSLSHIFIEYCEYLRKKPFSLEELKKIATTTPNIEHILSQTPDFKPKAFGFKNDDDFSEYQDMIGNLTLLEKKKNSSIRNKNPIEKVTTYGTSVFHITKKVGSEIAANRKFTKIELKERTKELSSYLADRWKC